MQNVRKYDAFISYRHLEWDMKVAEKLQKLLEKQKIKEENGTGKKRALQIFRDQSELPTSNDLGKDIRTALENSRYLIVICSRSYQESKWCMEEIEYFRSLHGYTNKNILPLLIEGEPDESFPEQLLWEKISEELGNGQIQKRRIEPLAADIRAVNLKKALKKLEETECLRIAAPILGVAFDDLYQRRKRAQRRMIAAVSAGITMFSLAFGVYSWYMFRQISDKQFKIILNESNRVEAEALRADADTKLALTVAMAGANMVSNQEIEGSDAYNALTSLLLDYEIKQNREYFPIQTTIPSNTVFKVQNTYAKGTVLAVFDYINTCLYDMKTGEKLFECPGETVYFNADATICVLLEQIEDEQRNSMHVTYKVYDIVKKEQIGKYQTELPDDVKDEETGDIYNTRVGQVLYDGDTNAFYLGESYYCWGEEKNGFHFFKKVDETGMITDAPEAFQNYGESMTYLEKNGCSNQMQNAYKNCAYDPDEISDSVTEKQYACIYYREDGKLYSVIKDKEEDQTLSVMEGFVCYVEDSHQMLNIQEDRIDILDIKGIREVRQLEMLKENNESIIRKLISKDGKSYLQVIKKLGTYVLRYGTIGKPASFEREIYLSPDDSLGLNFCGGEYPFYTNSMMTHVAYVTPQGRVVVENTDTEKVLFEIQVEEVSNVCAVAIDEEAKYFAISRFYDAGNISDGCLDLYRIEDAKLVQTLRAEKFMQVYWLNGERQEQRCGIGAAIEFSEDYLMLGGCFETLLFPRYEEGMADETRAEVVGWNGCESYGMPRYLTSDGLLFISSFEVYGDFSFRGVYDLDTMEELTVIATVFYPKATGLASP